MDNHIFNVVLGAIFSLSKSLQIKDFENEIKKSYDKIEKWNKSLYELREKKISFYKILENIEQKKRIKELENNIKLEIYIARALKEVELAFIKGRSFNETAILNGLIK